MTQGAPQGWKSFPMFPMTLSTTRNIKLTSVGLLLRFHPRPHGFSSIIQSVTDVLSDLIYKCFSPRCYVRYIGTGPSRGQFSQTFSLPFVQAYIFSIKHNPTIVSVIPHHGSSHDTFKEMELAQFCTDVEYYLVYAESWFLGHSWEYRITYKTEFPVCVLD